MCGPPVVAAELTGDATDRVGGPSDGEPRRHANGRAARRVARRHAAAAAVAGVPGSGELSPQELRDRGRAGRLAGHAELP